MSRGLTSLGVLVVALSTGAASAQPVPTVDHGSMPGMDDSSKSGMDHSPMPGMKHDPAPAAASGTALPAGSAPAPAPPQDHYADKQFHKADMERARAAFMHDQGGQVSYLVMLNLAELQFYRGQAGYRWDGEAWFGRDINRLTIKSEGLGSFREGVEEAEVQALYSRAIGPYFHLQAGDRQDLRAPLHQTYATDGFGRLAPPRT
ncbi:MAG: hypothetical protein B7X78_01350, partial [Sphingomonadales bacterium 39-62-4]